MGADSELQDSSKQDTVSLHYFVEKVSQLMHFC